MTHLLSCRNRNHNKLPCLKMLIVFFVLISLGLLAVSFFDEATIPFIHQEIDATKVTIQARQFFLRIPSPILSSSSSVPNNHKDTSVRTQVTRSYQQQSLMQQRRRNPSTTTTGRQLIPSSTSHQEDVLRDFVPLSCNANIEAAPCESFSKVFGSANIFATRVIIPCGKCIIMDEPSIQTRISNYTFENGIDIIGKLVIPDIPQHKIIIHTSSIIVQGTWEMTSITSPITSQPNIQIIMIDTPSSTITSNESDISYFVPVDTNLNACTSVNNTCNIGKKGIVVAGGTVNLRGIPPDTPTWVHLYDMARWGTKNDTIFLPKSIYGKWSVGAEVVITSHTTIWDDAQVRTIASISNFFAPNSDYVTVRLNETILHPTTLVESKDFAVEVALLSRNIALIGAPDSTNPKHGGHIMISYTPNVQQLIEGIEIRNFGQQGNLGRYPIHFHFCNNVTGSVVSKNTIRQSNQRCIVVHGTNKLRIEQNVAFDTKGHCYMTEDGIETDNEFLYNIGAQTGVPDTVIANEGPNGIETDHEPSTFWITNPTNTFIGNVAAGSQHSAYWFEPKVRGIRAHLYPGYNPMFEPLTVFKDNVAHSNNCGKTGAIRLYTPGYRPKSLAVFDGLKIYRNVGGGIFIHRNHNVLVVNSLFADNHISIDIDRAEGIEVNNTVVIGESASYRKLRKRQKVSPVCSRQGVAVGLELHTWKSNLSLAGAAINDVEFYDFDSIEGCKNVSSIAFDKNTLKGGMFEYYSTFRNISFYKTFLGLSLMAADNKINLCLVESAEFDMIYMSDLDGTLSRNTMLSEGPSTLLASDTNDLLTFVDPRNCTFFSSGCYTYCKNTCFRSVRFSYEGSQQEALTLKVCRRGEPTLCSMFRGGRRGEIGPFSYVAHLPVGNLYDATLIDNLGVEVTSGSLIESYEPSNACPSSFFNVSYTAQLNHSGNR